MLSEPDEQDPIVGVIRKPHRIWSHIIFCSMISAFITSLILIEVFAVGPIARSLGFRDKGDWPARLWMLNLAIAGGLTERIFKWMGHSQSGKVVEERKPTSLTPEGDVGDDEVAEVYLPRSQFMCLVIVCLFFCIPCYYATLDRPNLMAAEFWIATSLGVSLMLCAVFFSYPVWRKVPRARADSNGISYTSWWPFPRKFVPWSSVATCEITNHYNTFGDHFRTQLFLKGFDGQTLLKQDIAHCKPEDQERLVAYIRAKLPKLHEDLWDWE
ncbi:hypothetical protein [Singulisphaera sp. PoT]|uniref:hypothetical protein n=1 Tax=Singulisphaera sp. PoT TaxID=3411797 RepID=UPI003BF52613